MFNNNIFIDCYVFNSTGDGVRSGPPDVDAIDHIVFTQTEVKGRGTVGQISIAKLYFTDPITRRGPDGHPGADGLKVLFDANEVNTDEVIVVIVIVAKHGR